MGHMRSFEGHLVTQNSKLISAINSESKKLQKDILDKVRFGKKVMFSCQYGSLVVIW